MYKFMQCYYHAKKNEEKRKIIRVLVVLIEK